MSAPPDQRARSPRRLGFAVSAEFQLLVATYPGIRRGDVLEALPARADSPPDQRRRASRRTFKRVLAGAMEEAHGVVTG